MQKSTAEIKKIAKDVRLQYNELKPPIDAEKICSSLGIKIIRKNLRDLEEKTKRKISGIIYIDKNTEAKKDDKRIFVNDTDIKTRQNFTIAHELGHYFMHLHNKDGFIISFRGTKSEEESEADFFASELLMPQELVEKAYKDLPFPTASYLANMFNVSIYAMTYKLKEMGLKFIGR